MDAMRAPSEVYDKQLTLEILKTNCIPAIELVDGRKCAFPVVGRMHGHHQGRDIAIVEDAKQAQEEGFDYFTKLYSITREYRIEVEALSIKKIEEAIKHGEGQSEFPIRTSAFGWTWSDLGKLNEELQLLAIRSLYVVGLPNGFVKLGMLEDGSPIVMGITPPPRLISIPCTPSVPSLVLGADVEFMLDYQGDLVPASRFFPVEGQIGCDERQIEQDSGAYALAEIRPPATESPCQLFHHIQQLLTEASDKVPYRDIAFRAGSMPFSGYQCGGHIHFGVGLSLSLLRALDHYLAIPLAMIEDSRTAKRRRRTKHGGLGRYRLKPYGFEYMTPSSWMIQPGITLAVLCLAKIVAAHHHELPSDFLFDPLVQRAYYGGNRTYLKHKLWVEIKHRVMNTSSYEQYEQELCPLFDSIERESIVADSGDIRQNWGITVRDEHYDPGFTIRISKKVRHKFNLEIGQTTYIRTKKSIAIATVDAHPFAFQNSFSVQLSDPLRTTLALPKSWYPQVFLRDGVLSLGPIIGILASRPFWGQSTYFRHLCRLGQQRQVLVYVFEPQDIDWDRLVIKGTSEHGSALFPFPDVIYDRYFVGGNDNNFDINEIRMKFQAVYDIAFVNPPSLFRLTADKWQCHQVLSVKHHKYLPYTRLLSDPSDVVNLLERYGELYVKPVHGALGKSVFRVLRQPTGIFWMSSRERKLARLDNEQNLFHVLSRLIGENDYVIQQGIVRRQLDGRDVEIRVYMQKNSQGKWMRTGMVARLCNEGILTEETETNMRASEVLRKLFPNSGTRQRVHDELAQFARSIVATVEQHVGSFGELAIDVCIDHSNSIKLIELNSKPDHLFAAIHAFKLRNLAGYRLLNYAASLSGYESEQMQ